MLILVFLALNNAAPRFNNNNNFIYIAKIDQLNLNTKTAGIKIKYLKLVLAIKKILKTKR